MDGTLGETRYKMTGNTTLVEHGIQNDESNYRIHVSFGVGKAYFFPTESGKMAVEKEIGEVFEASQPGTKLITGKGRKVPWVQIEGCSEIDIPQSWIDKIDCQWSDGPGEKGKKAVTIAKALLTTGRVPMPVSTREVNEKDIQIRGLDLIVTSKLDIQVKCDWWGGRTGIRLQTHECNPFGIH